LYEENVIRIWNFIQKYLPLGMDIEFKYCPRCKKTKFVNQFGTRKHPVRGSNPKSYCKSCESSNSGEYQKRNKDKANAYRDKYRANNQKSLRVTELRRQAKIKGYDPDEAQAIFEQHDGKCDICRRTPKEANSSKKYLSIDHCHSTNKIRGMLCNNCNLALGMLQDSPELLAKAIEYIKAHKIKVTLI